MWETVTSKNSDFSTRQVVIRYDNNGLPQIETHTDWEYQGHISAFYNTTEQILQELKRLNNQHDAKSMSDFQNANYRANFKTKLMSNTIATIEHHDMESNVITTVARYMAFQLTVYYPTEQNPAKRWVYRGCEITTNTHGKFCVNLHGHSIDTESLVDALLYIDQKYTDEDANK